MMTVSGNPIASAIIRMIGLYAPFEFGKRTLVRKLGRYAFDRSRPVRVRRAGLVFELDLREEIDQWVYATGWWEKADLKAAVNWLRNSQVVFDVGANVGLFSLHAARAVGAAGHVYAFEPNPPTQRRLARNIELNKLSNVSIESVALSDEAGRGSLFLPKAGSSGGASLLEGWRDIVDERKSDEGQSEMATKVPLTTLDAFCAERSIERIDSIKVDVEGLEAKVLNGGRQTLMASKPRMLIEFNRPALAIAGLTAEVFLEMLQDFGYAVARIPRFGRSPVPLRNAADLPEDLCNLHCRARSI